MYLHTWDLWITRERQVSWSLQKPQKFKSCSEHHEYQHEHAGAQQGIVFWLLQLRTQNKKKKEITWKWICGSHSKISWLRKNNNLFMLWHWSLAEDGSSHLGSRSGSQELHYRDKNATGRNWQNEGLSQLSKGDCFSNHFPLFESWGKHEGINKEHWNECNSLPVLRPK